MATRLTYVVLAFGTVGLSALAYAQGAGTGVLKLPQDIEFKGPLTGPPQTVVLYGDPTNLGVFVSRVKFSAGWKDPPHPLALLCAGRERQGGRRATEHSDELAPFQLIELHSVPCPPGPNCRISNWRGSVRR